MVYTARSRKQFWNCSSINGFLLVVTLVFMCVSHVISFDHDNKNVTDCSKLRTCQKCAKKTLCSWSLKQQTCVKTTQWPEAMIVNIPMHCPQFSIVDSFVYKSHLIFTYKLKVSNDVSGFVKYLNSTNITCFVRGKLYNGTVDQATETINCASVNSENLELNEQKTMIYHFNVMFNNVTLRFDGVNNYFTVYNGEYDNFYCHDIYRTKDCVSCFWDSENYTFYYKRCPSSNTCTGLFEFYDLRDLNTNVGTSDERTSRTDNKTTTANRFGPPANVCPDMRIQLVEPLSAPWSSLTTLVITISNHNVLAESQMVTVTVAGRDCNYPKTLNGDTIECTIAPPKPNDLTSGPVHVMYGSSLVLKSDQTFQFIYPELTAVSPNCGPVTGGTLLRIIGQSLDASRTITVTVGPANVMCELVARYADHILCMTGPSNGSVAGDVTVEFDKTLRRTVGPASNTAVPSVEQFVYAADPVLDAGQLFVGISSGGTYIPVHGRHFSCVRNATLYVDDLNGMRHNTDCAVHNDTFMVCWSPALDVLQRSSNVTTPLKFGFHIQFADHMQYLHPQLDFPTYLLFADPEFKNFETNGRNVTIYGRHMTVGYRPSVDLVIRLRNAKGALCKVIEMKRHSIVCERPPPADSADNDFDEVYITVGNKFFCIVIKNKERSWGVVSVFLLIVSILTGGFILLLLGIIVYLLWKTKFNNYRNL